MHWPNSQDDMWVHHANNAGRNTYLQDSVGEHAGETDSSRSSVGEAAH